MKTTKVFFASLLAVLLAACGDKAATPANTDASGDRVKFYTDHDAERKAKLADCTQHNVDRQADTADAAECRAAGKAADQALFKPAAASEPKQYKQF
ncbi:MAG: hypothetical protein I4O48_05305 [Ralstonia sp.]|nr:hypothetical protein [Ralstonia sp.]